MSYNKLFKRIFAESNYTQQELADKCNVSRSYIGNLLNNITPVPDEEISRAIARACNIDERLLVIEGYIDKAPKEIKDFLIYLKSLVGFCCLNFYENKADIESFNILKKQLEEETLCDFIIKLLNDKNNTEYNNQNMFEIKTEDGNIIFNISKPFTLKANDNSMYPLIKENDELSIEIKTTYHNGDIIAFNPKNTEDIFIRQIMFLGKDIEAIPLNAKYKRDFYNKNEIIILGKITKITTNI